MRRLILSFATLLLAVVAMAVPANREPVKVQQPDGTTITIRLHGDEYMHFTTTADGYSVVRNDHGYYVYARLHDGQLAPTTQVAHDAGERNLAEQQFLQGVTKYLAPDPTPDAAREQQAEQARRSRALSARKAAQYDYDNFRGLILLVEYNDCEFSREDYAEVMNDMANKEGYKGYGNSGTARFTGSVRDYYADNSNGIFVPQFDVIGPVQVDRSQYYVRSTQNAGQLMVDALTAADSLVDYSQYDRDGDGQVDMVYFIFAGMGANFGGNDSRLLWPHASYIYNPTTWQPVRKDGVRFGRYACSVELYGTSAGNFLDGIGTICHEFGHVLGLPDLYDTDYEGSGGESNHPADWTIMASGSYLNYSRTPAGYTLWERYALGFCQPQTIDSIGSYTLERLDLCHTGFRIDSPVKKEYFLLENRQKSYKWDAHLPGHGMLVFRVDSTSASAWSGNSVNDRPSHNYFELLRAGNGTGAVARATDPFPGTNHVTILNASTTPALASWKGNPVTLGLTDIKESNEVITFELEDATLLRALKLPETYALPLGFKRTLELTAEPYYATYELTWTSSDESVVTVDENGLLTGVGEGSCVITVTSDGGITASCTVTVSPVEAVSDLAAFKSGDEGSEAMVRLTDAQVVFANSDIIFLRDASGAISIPYSGLDLLTNDVLNGYIYGRFTVDKLMPQLETVEGLTMTTDFEVSEGEAAQPRHVKLLELSDTDRSDYVVVDTVQVTLVGNRIYAYDGDRQIRIFNTLGVKGLKAPSSYDGKYFNVTGIYGTNEVDGELIDEIYLLASPEEVEAPTAIRTLAGTTLRMDFDGQQLQLSGLSALTSVSVYAVDGRTVATTTATAFGTATVNAAPWPDGIYIVKADGHVLKLLKQ